MDLYNRYKKEITDDLKFDAFNLKETAMLVPSKKHFWIARLNDHRITAAELKNKKVKIIKSLMEKAESASPVKLSKTNLEKMLEEMPEMVELDSKIAEQEHLIKYLEDSKWVFASFTDDVKNAIETTKLEQL
jgi:hypothetical protein